MNLNKSRVIFNPENHTYTLDGKELSGITSVISRQLFPDKYRGIPEDVLQRAAERGTMIHEICELIDDMGITHERQEAKGYEELKEIWGLRYECSEYLVSDNENYASFIDKVYRESDTDFTLGDIKTTYKLDKDSVQWQLSIYAYFFELNNPGCKAVRLIVIWLRGENHEIVEVERIPSETIIELLKCDSEGKQFNKQLDEIKSTLPAEFSKMENYITEVMEQAEYWANKKKEIQESAMMAMVKSGEYSWKGNSVSFTRRKDSIRKDFDKKAFQKDYPELYNKYIKDTSTVGSVTIKTIKQDAQQNIINRECRQRP